MRIVVATGLLMGLAAPVAAQFAPSPDTITIAASGRVETPPDIATLSLTMRGEGQTSDAATTGLARKQKAIMAGVQRIDPRLVAHTGSVSIREVRTGNCAGGGGSFPMDGLDTVVDTMEAVTDGTAGDLAGPTRKGPCRVVGALAEMSAEIELASVKDVGTVIGLAGRLGAASAALGSFGLRDPTAANRRAVAAAITNARADASVIAEASGARLGALVSVSNTDQNRSYALAMAPPGIVNVDMAASMAPPVVLDVAPKPVETSAQLTVTFAILK